MPTFIGGEVHLMIGIKYLRYHPKMLFQLVSGLAIYSSSFTSSSAGRRIIGGIHPNFSKVHQSHTSHESTSTFFTHEYKTFCKNVNPDVTLLGYSMSDISSHYDIQYTEDSVHSLSTSDLSKAMRI